MSAYNVVSRAAMASGQPEDISVVLANFDAIATVVNGNLDNTNVVAGAGIALTKLASAGQIGASGVTIGANSITLSGDTTLSRAAAGQLQTGGFFLAISDVLGRYGVATQMRLGGILGNTVPGLTFGSAEDTSLYRNAANQLRTDGSFQISDVLLSRQNVSELRISGTAGQSYVTIGAVALTAGPSAGYNILHLGASVGTAPGAQTGGGQLFTGSDGKLYYKGIAGTLTAVAPS